MILKLLFKVKETLFWFTLGCFISLPLSAQNWEATDLTIFDAFPIVDIQSHNNTLFATVNQVFLATLEASTDDGQTWATKSATNAVGWPNLMAVTANDRLYLSTINGTHNLLYYSLDNGDSFLAEDVTGLPEGIGGGVSSIVNLQAFGNMLVVGMGGAGYYAKDVSNPSSNFVHFDTSTGLNSGTDFLAFNNGSLYTYDNAGAKTFYISTDFGLSWSTPAAVGLPSDLQSEILEINPTNGRIYLSGESDFDGNLASEYGLYYSDDAGENWSEVDLSVVAPTNYLGDFHKVTSLYANDNLIYMAFDNDAEDTAPDVVSSDNFDTVGLAIDTQGLPNVPGNVHGVEFLVHNGNIVMSLNILDVYVKNGVLSHQEYDSVNGTVNLFPTIVDNVLHIEISEPFIAEIFNSSGKKISTFNLKNQFEIFELSHLSSGVYILIFTNNNTRFTKRIIKR
jgi:hypothetical protein